MDYTRVLDKLDHLVETKDFDAARELLDYWIADAVESRDKVGELNLYNESMGLYRKIGDMEKAMESVSKALSLAESDAMAGMIITGTTFVNAATVYKAFGQAADSIPLFEKAKALYETDLREDDVRLGGLYNNMGLALLDLKRYDEALDSYRQALGVMEKVQYGKLESAITYLNMADVYDAMRQEPEFEALHSLDEWETIFENLLDNAWDAIDDPELPRNGYYAFVAEKCAPVFGYYGRFMIKIVLEKRIAEIMGQA